MYTRCPKCQTTFRITAAQLKARDGQVRCGRCQHIFRADTHLVDAPVRKAKSAAVPRKRAPKKSPDSVASAPQPRSAPPPVAITRPYEKTAPLPLLLIPRTRTRLRYWLAGCSLLGLLLLAQGLIFYGPAVTRQIPQLRSTVDLLCDRLPCRMLPGIDMARMDLVETEVAPHPRYDKALRVKATLVNRAAYPQPYPQLEVSLIDSQGRLVARRVYPPEEYLGKSENAQLGLPPQVAVKMRLDITSPGAQASGYEVLLLPPPD